jgi:DNA repair protein RadD
LIKLRDYQRGSIDSVHKWFNDGRNNPLVVLPTGAGKSVVLAEFIREAIEEFPSTHILVLTHSKELIQQDYDAIKRSLPRVPIGIYSAGIGKRQIKQVTVAGIQSVYKKEEFYGSFDLIIVDEAHLIPHSSDGMYRKLLDSSLAVNEHVKVIGLTATPYRLDSGMLHEGEGAIFDGVSYEANVGDLVNAGYLCKLTARHGADVDLDGVRTTGGDYNIGQLGERMSAVELVNEHCDRILELCDDRKSWLIFCVTIDHAVSVRQALMERGIAVEMVNGETPKTVREEHLANFKSGNLRALVNVGVLTTGFDYPALDCIIIIRPTQSPGLFVQMAGRGLRKHESKEDTLLLDFGGNIRRHGLIDRIVGPRRRGAGKGAGVAPTKECPECGVECFINSLNCQCGYEFPIKEREAERMHHTGAVMAVDMKHVDMNVSQVTYAKHITKAGAPCVRADYWAGVKRISEYILFEHQGYARAKAINWWLTRQPDGEHIQAPANAEEAMSNIERLKKPKAITVDMRDKYPSIIKYQF